VLAEERRRSCAGLKWPPEAAALAWEREEEMGGERGERIDKNKLTSGSHCWRGIHISKDGQL
jgi:hypothetical protein